MIKNDVPSEYLAQAVAYCATPFHPDYRSKLVAFLKKTVPDIMDQGWHHSDDDALTSDTSSTSDVIVSALGGAIGNLRKLQSMARRCGARTTASSISTGSTFDVGESACYVGVGGAVQ